jgi:hypothetical protein
MHDRLEHHASLLALLTLWGLFLFGNNCQAIEIAKGHFKCFPKCALKSLNNQTDFDSAIRRFDPSRPSHPLLALTPFIDPIPGRHLIRLTN